MFDNSLALFIAGTGTGVGKTFLTRGLARAAVRRGAAVAALKPIETGCEPDPADAVALATAAGHPELARAPGLYRARRPLSPLAATRQGEAPPPEPLALATRIHELSRDADVVLVEGAGGLLVPVDATHTMADLVAALRAPLLLVAADRLGVLSDVLCYTEVAARRGLPLAAVVLNRVTADTHDPSRADNHAILSERLDCPVRVLPCTPDNDDALADAVTAAGLHTLITGPNAPAQSAVPSSNILKPR